MNGNPRYAALMILHETVQNGGYPNLLQKQAWQEMEARDRRFVTLLVQETLTRLIHIDYILSLYLRGKRTKPIIRNILRLGVCQLMFLKLSPPAVIHESVELTKQAGKGMLSGVVNGVLRSIDRADTFPYPPKDSLAYLSIMTGKPEWLIALWEKQYGREAAVRFATPRKLDTTIRWNHKKFPAFDVPAWLKEHGYEFTPYPGYEDLYALSHADGLTKTDAFLQGKISIQGPGSVTACQALDVQPGDHVLDACSAPGGKTLYLAEQLGHTGSLTACDLHEHRLKLVKENLRRGGYACDEYRVMDMTVFLSEWTERFDRVLADTPCSGLGVLNSKPDILLRQSVETIRSLAGVQQGILDQVCRYVKKGGTLVYSTCTINQWENDGVVNQFLQNHPDFQLEAFSYGKNRHAKSGILQLTPDQSEGFFMARFQRK